MELIGKNIVVLDLETLHSADDCLYCGQPFNFVGLCTQLAHHKIGWDNHKALGLSVGCYYDYGADISTFFGQEDVDILLDMFVMTQPLLVSFNGIGFDFPLLLAVSDGSLESAFVPLYVRSYDILAEIWKIAPADKFKRGINSLAALAKANNLPLKEMDGATAPLLWAEGKYEEVKEYNFNDVLRTRFLFEMICNGQPIIRGDGSSLTLPVPAL